MKTKNYKYLIILAISLFISTIISVSATILYNANEVIYDNTTSGLNSTTVQDAIDELYSSATNYSSYQSDVDDLKSYFDDNTDPINITGSGVFINGSNASDTFSDTGWVLLNDFESNFKNYGTADGYKMRIRKIGNMVTIHGSIALLSSSPTDCIFDGDVNTPVKVLTIPSQYRPTYPSYTLQPSTGKTNYLLAIEPNGNMNISRVVVGTGNSYFGKICDSDNFWFGVEVTYMLN